MAVSGLSNLSVALWPFGMSAAPASRDAFLEIVAMRAGEAREAGARLLVLPEYVCEAWLTYAPPGLAETDEVAWMAAEAEALLPRLESLARRLDLALLPGTMPAAVGRGRFRNRAYLFLPDGRTLVQDKLTLTPDERDPNAWTLEPGDALHVVQWEGLRLAILICLDVEQPAIAARLQGLDVDLLLVPSDTGRLSGHSRVFTCAKARAVELFCAVAAVGGVGTIPLDPPRPNVSGAAVYLPCEVAFGFTGTLADTGPIESTVGAGELVLVNGIPMAEIRAQRRLGGEVWPGPFDAGTLRIGELAPAPSGAVT